MTNLNPKLLTPDGTSLNVKDLTSTQHLRRTGEDIDSEAPPTVGADLTAIEALSGVGFPARIAADSWALRTIQGDGSRMTVGNGDGVAGNPAITISFASSKINLTTEVTGTLPIANGGTGQTSAQAAINALTQVSGATNEHVLTKDTATGDAIFKAASGGSGEANTASNVGGATGQVFKQKTGVDLEMKTFAAGANIGVTNGTSTITIAISGQIPIANGGTGQATAQAAINALTTEQFILSGSISAAAGNDIAIGNVGVYNVNSGTSLTGMTGGANGRIVIIFNNTGGSLTIAHATTSSAANQFYCPSGANFSLARHGVALAMYDGSASKWRVIDPASGLTTVNLASDVTGTLPIANGGTGQTTRAAALTGLGVQVAAKSADQTQTLDASLGSDDNDNDLQFTLESGGVYLIGFDLNVISNATPDLKFDFDGGTATLSSCVGGYWFNANGVAAVTGNIANASTDISIIVATWTSMKARIWLRVACSSGGTFVFRHCQNTSNVRATGMGAGSVATCIRIS